LLLLKHNIQLNQFRQHGSVIATTPHKFFDPIVIVVHHDRMCHPTQHAVCPGPGVSSFPIRPTRIVVSFPKFLAIVGNGVEISAIGGA